MSRPQKQTVDYFPHDAHASSGDTVSALQGQWGNTGYAFWFKLLEKLASSDGHFIDCSNTKKWQLILGRAGVDEDTGEKIMNLLVEMHSIDKELWQGHRIIWSQNLVNNLATVYQNRRRELPQRPISGNQLQSKLDPASNDEISTGENPVSTGNNSITTGENPQSKVKESKVNNSIEGKSQRTKNDVLKAYREKIGDLNESRERELRIVIRNMSADWVYDAITEAARKREKTWGYVYGILRNWRRDGKPNSC
jgi:DnaD/phage-associated family protein